MRSLLSRNNSIAVVYLARGADDGAITKFKVFCDSYRRWRAGIDHRFYVIFKGFANAAELALGREVFREVVHGSIYVEDNAFDLGAYLAAASRLDQQLVCFFNTASEIRGTDWLLKLAVNLQYADVGLVGCTGSYEAPQHPGMVNVTFPNPHLRSNAFMIRRDRFLAMGSNYAITDKIDAYMFEHGREGLSRRIVAQGLRTLLVGKNGRGYEPAWWGRSDTFRQGRQANLLVADNQTRNFEKASLPEKRHLFRLSWGDASPLIVDRVLSEYFGQVRVSNTGNAVPEQESDQRLLETCCVSTSTE